MGPKRKRLPATDSGQTSKQPKKSRSDDVTTPVIDYDLLADAIIRKQNINKVSSNASDSSTSVDTVSDNTRSSTMLVENSVQQQPSTSEMHATRTITPLLSEQNTGTSAMTFSQRPQTSASTFASTSDFSNMLNQLFSGESRANDCDIVTPISVNDGIPLGANVPLRVKNKIWADQFVDFKTLLPNYKEQTVSIQIESNSLSFSDQSSSKSQSQISIEQWTTAFFSFMAIYLVKQPLEGPNLLKYGSVIREIASSHGDAAWRHYDENFRKLQQSSHLPWQRTLSELLVSACTIHRNKQTFRSNFRSKQLNKSPKVCFNFNNGTKCRAYPCPFSHICQSCQESHPRIKCNRRNSEISKSSKLNSNPNKS